MEDMEANYSHRVALVKATLNSLPYEALLFLDMKNIRYLCGFFGSEGMLLLTHKEIFLLVDGRYITQAKSEATGVRCLEYREKFEIVSVLLEQKKIKKIGVESTALSVDEFNSLKRKLRGVSIGTVADKLKQIRITKEEIEIESIRQGAEIVSRVIFDIVKSLPAGITEKELAALIEYRIKMEGAEGTSFDTIVASGENAALPHAKPTSRNIAAGDALLIDCGAVVNGYASDESCTFFIGTASPRQKSVYAIVKEAHDLAIAEVRPGVLCCEIDKIVRDTITAHGMGDLFPHSTGHGVGLAVHEEPRITINSKSRLEAGMVVTIEPGIYIPGEGGVRIEDTVHLTHRGAERLTSVDKVLRAR